ncbi:hypothetical protein [Hyphomonas oceanitis]|uniref:Uncharacterized protein n=1 Tax=Hyphomonas oceanitis SCH89 TaxID=1280953 RepID=A0A059G783_9PROT|nr:hypothetical protein [Hyphomonas oceanitis]KDA02589.1 hypothetical protein HOC_10224 [Hyphomonas oceanitis SCH89]
MSFLDLDNIDTSSTWRPNFLVGTDKPVWLKVSVQNGGQLMPTKTGTGKNLVLRLTVKDAPKDVTYFSMHMLMEGNGSDGHAAAIKGNMAILRAIVDSAYGNMPSDQSAEAASTRKLADFSDLDRLSFLAFIRNEQAPDGKWYNRLGKIVTADMPGYPPRTSAF